MTKFLSRLTLGALAVLPLLAGPVAHAQAARIEVSDLDLSSPAQVTVLNARIDRAAKRYCGGLDGQDLARRDACRVAFKDEAADQLRNGHREQEARRMPRPSHGAG